ncbi:CapA family protein [Aureispira anguillae]|uniref:CapA family protein n=1 Tax=Aureispira anguillae TaxID=2864201 RepID=A0A915YGU5_9BACT|nr:CapA family protein [Aureispira anguillae]BDS12899.1 CapA family protein [Aureispira anguillae]
MRTIFSILLVLVGISCIDSSDSSASIRLKPSPKGIAISSKDSIHRLKLSFVGDIMGHKSQLHSAAGTASNMKSTDMSDFNYETCFRYVKPILEAADLTIGNLELTLNDKGRYTGFPMFRSPDALATYLKDAGFDLLTTCNNHSNDNLAYGVTHTIDVLDSLGILHTGTFKNQAERDDLYPLIVEKKVDGANFKLAFLNYTYATNGVRTRKPCVVNLIEQNQIYKDIVKAKEAQPDMIIAIMHWGDEYKLEENQRQAAYARFLWENGVDVVIGAHPHVIEPIKTDTLWQEDSTQFREVLVAYSLGNFISNQYKTNTDIGLIFELELIKNSRTNQTIIGQHDYVLAWRYIQGRYNFKLKRGFDWTYAVIPVTAFENAPKKHLLMMDRQWHSMKATAQRMRKHLGRWQSKERKVTLEDLGAVLPLTPKKKRTQYKK